MNRLMTNGNVLIEDRKPVEGQPQSPVIRSVAKVISYIFHPLFIPVYLLAFMMWRPPFFAGFSAVQKSIDLLALFIIYSFFPLVTVLLLKGVGFIDSIFLKNRRDRIIPYIACGIFYFWRWYVFRNQSQYDPEIVELAFALFLSSSLGLMANIYFKISMHAIAMGVVLVFMAYLGLHQTANYAIYLSVTFLLVGLVCTARMIVSDHTPAEIYVGLLAGAVAQLVSIGLNGLI